MGEAVTKKFKWSDILTLDRSRVIEKSDSIGGETDRTFKEIRSKYIERRTFRVHAQQPHRNTGSIIPYIWILLVLLKGLS